MYTPDYESKWNLWFQSLYKKYESEYLRSIADHEKAIVKVAMLMNGGAALALLAFIGSIWSIKLDEVVVTSLTLALSKLIWGLLAAVGALIFGYILMVIVNTKFMNAEIEGRNIKEEVIIKLIPMFIMVLPIILLLIASIALFIFGTSEAIEVLRDHFISELNTQVVNGG